MNQTALIFDPTGERVREWHKHGPTGEAIRRFFIGRYKSETWPQNARLQFRADDLIDYVRDQPKVTCSQASVTRILRLMREDGMVDYGTIGARRKGLYGILGVRVSETEILGSIRWDGRTKG